jgi:hypothetical protein
MFSGNSWPSCARSWPRLLLVTGRWRSRHICVKLFVSRSDYSRQFPFSFVRLWERSNCDRSLAQGRHRHVVALCSPPTTKIMEGSGAVRARAFQLSLAHGAAIFSGLRCRRSEMFGRSIRNQRDDARPKRHVPKLGLRDGFNTSDRAYLQRNPATNSCANPCPSKAPVASLAAPATAPPFKDKSRKVLITRDYGRIGR